MIRRLLIQKTYSEPRRNQRPKCRILGADPYSLKTEEKSIVVRARFIRIDDVNCRFPLDRAVRFAGPAADAAFKVYLRLFYHGSLPGAIDD